MDLVQMIYLFTLIKLSPLEIYSIFPSLVKPEKHLISKENVQNINHCRVCYLPEESEDILDHYPVDNLNKRQEAEASKQTKDTTSTG